ncbi:MAG: Gfo/Idh/MocA family oxidoreductase [bacterium]|nr:Gfo/Idh/MocA family oxidoreductase [bacterium]
MKTLSIGVIGLGMGRNHITDFHKHPQARVIAIADASPERLKEIGDKHNITHRYTDAAEMLRAHKFDIVSIATPNVYHAPLTIAALNAGAHVLCEKPMAMSAREARAMLAAAKKARRRLMINFSYRFTEQSWALKQQVDTGILGDVYFARTLWHRRRGLPGFGGWFGQKALSGGGPLIDLGVHRLDLALWLMGYPKPAYVLGRTYNPIGTRLAKEQNKKFDTEDLAAAFITFENGASLEIEASWAANIKEREMMETRLYGTKAGLVQRNLNEGYEFEAELFLEKNGCQFDMRLHPPVPAVKGACVHFVEAILGNKPHIATGEEGATVMELLDAIYTSAATGKPVRCR